MSISSSDYIEFKIGREERKILESNGEIAIKTIFADFLKKGWDVPLYVEDKRLKNFRRVLIATVVDQTKERIILSKK
jgi:hypothetical protein